MKKKIVSNHRRYLLLQFFVKQFRYIFFTYVTVREVSDVRLTKVDFQIDNFSWKRNSKTVDEYKNFEIYFCQPNDSFLEDCHIYLKMICLGNTIL